MKKAIAIILSILIILTCLAGCSSDNGGGRGLKHITLSLDYTPNTNHTGLYVALIKGYYEEAGFDVSIVQPPEDDAISACSSGRVQYAVGFQDLLAPAFCSDTAMQVTAVAALLQHNTGCVISKKGSGMDRPRGLEGKSYLTWQSPIELAIMKSIVEADGGDWSRVEQLPDVPTDEAQDISLNPDHAIWVYYGWGGINAEVSGVDTDAFYFRELNPVFDYYSPVLVVSNDYMKESPEEVRAFLAATRRGYEYAAEHPEEAAHILIEGDETASLAGSEELVLKSQKWISEQYIADAAQWGYIEPERWNAFYGWLNDNGLTTTPIPKNTGFTNDFLS